VIGTILYNIFIMPLELLFQILYQFGGKYPILGILLISIVMNFLALPLYMRADAIQEEERKKVASMSKWVSHIKKTFKGDERYMMLTRYYKQENYKPIYAMRSTFSLLLQIPFFIAAYNYLSNLSALNGQAFWIISDLGAPDNLITIGGLHINILPILMTLINLISGYLYLRGFPLKEKIQTYGIAIVFLVLLYDRPAGLVLYWTLNQVFSALKNVFLKYVKSKKANYACISLLGIFILLIIMVSETMTGSIRTLIIGAVVLVCQLPLIFSILKIKIDIQKIKPLPTKLFLLATLLITLMIGLRIPLSVLAASPEEFVMGNNTPAVIMMNNISLAVGLFVVWIGVYYYMSNTFTRNVFTYIVSFIAIFAVVNFYLFNVKSGTLTTDLIFGEELSMSNKDFFVNAAVLAVAAIMIFVLIKYYKKIMPYLFTIIIVGVIGVSSIDGISVAKALEDVKVENNTVGDGKIINLSKHGKNVVVFMLDRAISGYVPFAFNNNPKLKEQFDGFTYYENTISFGGFTNFATPALFGGYEYRPTDINLRTDESLKDKHNEALLVMPKLFADNGFDVTVCDPPYTDYREYPVLSIYDGIDGVHAYTARGKYNDALNPDDDFDSRQLRNFFMYSILQASPNIMRVFIYDNGTYLGTSYADMNFIYDYGVLCSLTNMCNIKEDDSNNVLIMQNSTTHDPTRLNSPDYLPSTKETEKDIQVEDIYSEAGEILPMTNEKQISHYQTNMAAFVQLGKWFDYLRENDLYDNTRIIIVSDHGCRLNQIQKLLFDDSLAAEFYNPLFMVKDFNDKGFVTSQEFMTNADVPTIATDDLIENPQNPFTGKKIDSSAKFEKQFVTTSRLWSIKDNAGNVFDTSDGEWWTVEKNIFDKNNWQCVK